MAPKPTEKDRVQELLTLNATNPAEVRDLAFKGDIHARAARLAFKYQEALKNGLNADGTDQYNGMRYIRINMPEVPKALGLESDDQDKLYDELKKIEAVAGGRFLVGKSRNGVYLANPATHKTKEEYAAARSW